MISFPKSGMLTTLVLLMAAAPCAATSGIQLAAGQCGADECATGYSGTGSVTCSAAGEDFGLTGCSPMCVLPTDTTGYIVSSCSTTNFAIVEASCSVSCASGYRSTGDGPKGTCASGFGVFTLSGCEAIPSCNLPSDTTGYITTSCAATSSSLLTQDQCTVGCDTANGYAGSAADACPSTGTFAFSGCEFACTLPTDTALTTGYDTSSCTGSKTSAQCSVSCATGYGGTAVDTCGSAGGVHALSGCTALPKCNLPATTTGYTVSGCNNVYESQCSVTCASGYTGTGTDTCSSDGVDFVFGGCTPIPKCLATATTGYTITGCNTDNGALEATSCNAGCDTNYGGTATETCSTDGGAFVFGGCEPQCSLPTDMTGYTSTSCSGTRTAATCGLTCASGYTGTAAAACGTAGGTFALSGCMAIPKCSLPASNPGYDTSSCNTGRGTAYGIPASECSVGCSMGYSGTASAACSADGGTFALTGCTRVDTCTLPSSTTGYKAERCTSATCGDNPLDETSCTVECDTGYTGTATDTCTDGSFVLGGCVPMCVLPTDTTGYVVSSCSTTNFAIVEASCSVSCASGYRSTGDGPKGTCASGFGVFTLSGCEAIPSCNLPSDTTGYITTSCAATSSSLLTQDQCTVGCDTANGYAGSAADACPSTGTFAFSGCEFACTLPTDTALTTGYDTSSCTGSKTSAQCSVSCATGYGGTAVDTCGSAGGVHALSGCTALPKCNLPATTTGYTVSGCNNVYESQCSVTCASGYTGTGTDTCSSDGVDFVFGGCTPIPKCLATATTGYTITGCNTDNGALEATSCNAGCDTNYGGTATETCSTDGGAFVFGGCEPQCSLPTDMTGYTSTSCSGTRTAATCGLTCASGYTGTAAAACGTAGGTFALSGCAEIPKCTLPATNEGYITTNCNTGRGTEYGIPQSECTVTCASGWSGTATATCAAGGGTFTLGGCTRASTCTLPSSTTGYMTTMCPTSTGITCPDDSDGSGDTSGETGFAHQQGVNQMAALVSAVAVFMAF